MKFREPTVRFFWPGRSISVFMCDNHEQSQNALISLIFSACQFKGQDKIVYHSRRVNFGLPIPAISAPPKQECRDSLIFRDDSWKTDWTAQVFPIWQQLAPNVR